MPSPFVISLLNLLQSHKSDFCHRIFLFFIFSISTDPHLSQPDIVKLFVKHVYTVKLSNVVTTGHTGVHWGHTQSVHWGHTQSVHWDHTHEHHKNTVKLSNVVTTGHTGVHWDHTQSVHWGHTQSVHWGHIHEHHKNTALFQLYTKTLHTSDTPVCTKLTVGNNSTAAQNSSWYFFIKLK